MIIKIKFILIKIKLKEDEVNNQLQIIKWQQGNIKPYKINKKVRKFKRVMKFLKFLFLIK